MILKTSYSVKPRTIISISEFLKMYLFGVNIIDDQGRDLLEDSEIVEQYLLSAQQEVENVLNIKLVPQIVEEQKDFHRDDFTRWGYIRTTYPVVEPISMEGFIGEVKQITYPPEWISARKTSDKLGYRRSFNVVPNTPDKGATITNSAYYGHIPQASFWGNYQIPNYWMLKYWTGFEQCPADILAFVGKLASIGLFHVAGDLILGAGIANQSIGIDGLSQSISTTSSATNAGYGARIEGYLRDMREALPVLISTYRGILFTVA